MNPRTLALAGLPPLVLGLLAAASVPVRVPVAAPPGAGDGETSYTFVETTSLTVVHMRSETQGQVYEPADWNPELERTTKRAWTDAADQRADSLSWVREHTRADQSFALDIVDRNQLVTATAEGSADVERPRIHFAWNEASGEFVATPAGEEGADESARRPAWVDGLEADVRLRGLLPPKGLDAVGPEDEWDVEPEELRALLAPCGRLPMTYDGLEVAKDTDLLALYGALSTVEAAGAALDGEAGARFVERDETEGVAVLEVELDVTFDSDPTAWMIEQSRPHKVALMGQGAEDAELTLSLEGVARIEWDLAAAALRTATLEAETTARLDFDYTIHFAGVAIPGEYALDFEGQTSLTLVAER